MWVPARGFDWDKVEEKEMDDDVMIIQRNNFYRHFLEMRSEFVVLSVRKKYKRHGIRFSCDSFLCARL